MMARGSWSLDLLILTGLLAVFFGFKLGERALWSPDEGRYSEVAREMVSAQCNAASVGRFLAWALRACAAVEVKDGWTCRRSMFPSFL